MTSTQLNGAAEALLDLGNEANDNEDTEQINAAALAVGKLFAKVKAGKLDASLLTSLADWATNPSQGSPSSQQQPAALESNSGGIQPSTPDLSEITEQDALSILQGSAQISNGIKAALRRLLNPRDPNPIGVQGDGTPSEVADLRREIATLEGERDAARQDKADAERKLAEERDPNKAGSLARQLADAQATAANPVPSTPDAEVNEGLATVREKVAEIKSSWGTTTCSGKEEALRVIDTWINEYNTP